MLVAADRLRILVADDSEAFRAGLAALLASVADVTLVGEATSGEEAVARALELHPDVVLMDLNMPGRNGIEASGSRSATPASGAPWTAAGSSAASANSTATYGSRNSSPIVSTITGSTRVGAMASPRRRPSVEIAA